MSPSSALREIAQSDNPALSIEATGTYCMHLRIASLFARPDWLSANLICVYPPTTGVDR